jgi:YD repeat-containing protein
MNAKTMIGAALLALVGVGAYLWWSSGRPDGKNDSGAPVVKNPDKKNPGQVAAGVQPVVYQPAPVSLAAATEFLHTGPNPVQIGMDPKVLDARRAAALRGMVFKGETEPFPAVNVHIQHQPAYGTGYSRTDGSYDMVVNGGGLMTVGFKKEGFLPVWRQASVPWQDHIWLPPVVMSKVDSQVTAVKSDAKAIQTARGSKVKDKDGPRQPTLLFQSGTKAVLEMPDGTKKPLEALNIRATEYTVGDKGPDRMPAPLPPNSAYTYCVELSADEAIQANAKTVRFDKPVYHYVENFLNFPVGIPVPAGYFEAEKGGWVASESGRVIKVLAINNDLVDLDVEGNNQPADAKALAALKVSDDERRELAKLYAAGATLWRVPIPHFSVWDLNWGFSPPADAAPPQMPPPVHNPPVGKGGREAVEVHGLIWKLNHDNDRIPGVPAARTIRIPVVGESLPKSCKRIVIEIFIAGRRIEVELPANANQNYDYVWDGKDVFGRPMQCSPIVRIRIGYVYDGVYERTAVFGASGNGEVITGSRTRREVILWQEHQLVLAFFDARALALGGWSFDVQHAYDPVSRTLYLGNGERSTVGAAAGDVGNLVISTVAGGGKKMDLGDGGPALEARLDDPKASAGAGMARRRDAFLPRGLAVGPDGTLFIADANERIRRVDPDGTIRTIAGGGDKQDVDGKATDLRLQYPHALALDRDGSLLIAEGYERHRVRRLNLDGTITTVAGATFVGFSGDGGPALRADFRDPAGLAVAPDGTIYIADQGNHRIRRVSPDGIVSTIAGNGTQGYKGDGGPALSAELYWPTSLALAADGSLYFSDQGNYVVRRISNSGIITTVAGLYRDKWSPGFGGDDGPALQAKFNNPTGLAVGADGSLYIADMHNHRIRRVGPDGVIRAFAGVKPKREHGDFAGDQGPARLAVLSYPTGLAFGPDGSLYFYDASLQRGQGSDEGRHIRQRIRRISPPVPGFGNNEIAIPSPDGKEVFKFDPLGRHLETFYAIGMAPRTRLEYDKAGHVSKIEDVPTKTSAIFERDAQGRLSAIVAPQERKTAVVLDAAGRLASLTGPNGEQVQMTYTDDGLLQKVSGAGQKNTKVARAPASTKGTWQILDSGVTDDLHAVAFVGDNVGAAVGANQTILRTTDGGASWKRIMGPDKSDDFASVIFGNDKLGYVRNGFTGGLFRTQDAGASWTAFVNPNPSGLYSIKGFSAHTAREGSYYWMNYAGPFSSLALYKTEDAKNWTKLWDHENHTLGGSGASFVFTDANDAWMASTTHPGAKMWVGRSADGGKTWTSEEIKDKVRGGYMRVQAVNKDLGWFCSEYSNYVHASTDGGKTWSAHDLGTGEIPVVRVLQFVDAKTGYVLCGESWHVRKTTDGGKSWASLGPLTAPAAIHGMHFTPAGTGYVVGSKGYIARFQP